MQARVPDSVNEELERALRLTNRAVAEEADARPRGVDIKLALEMLARGDTFDLAYLSSGDSDFKRVLDLLQSRGKRVFVVSSRGSLSRELIHAADKPLFFMEDFREQLRRE